MGVELLTFVEINETLSNAFQELVPSAGRLVRLAQSIGGIGALIYLCYHIWVAWVREEPFDLFVLARPFIIGIIIAGFPQFVGVLNEGLDVVSKSTEQLSLESVEEVNAARQTRERLQDSLFKEKYLKEKELIKRGKANPHERSSRIERALEQLQARVATKIQHWILDLVEFIFLLASLAINVLRLFQLSVLAIFGPIIWGFAVWEGLSGGVRSWFTRYVQVFLWLPICHIMQFVLGRLESLMILIDIREYRLAIDVIHKATTMDHVRDALNQDAGSIWPMVLFYLIGTVSFMAVPTMAGYFIESGGVSGANQAIQKNLKRTMYNRVTRGAAAGVGHVMGKGAGAVGSKAKAAIRFISGKSSKGGQSGQR